MNNWLIWFVIFWFNFLIDLLRRYKLYFLFILFFYFSAFLYFFFLGLLYFRFFLRLNFLFDLNWWHTNFTFLFALFINLFLVLSLSFTFFLKVVANFNKSSRNLLLMSNFMLFFIKHKTIGNHCSIFVFIL